MYQLLTIAGVVLVLLSILAAQESLAARQRVLAFHSPHENQTAGQPLTVTGTSLHPNATATNCVVQVQLNDQGYNFAIGQGPPDARYMNWTFTTTPLHTGKNLIEAQLWCFPLGHHLGTSTPSLIKHLTHNVNATGVATPASILKATPTPSNGPPTNGFPLGPPLH